MRGSAQSALEPLMAAVYAQVAVPAVLSLCQVLNDVPQGTPLPYVVLESPTETPWNAMTEFGKDCTFQAHIVSKYHGDTEWMLIRNAVVAALDYARFAVDNHTFVDCKLDPTGGDRWKDEPVNGEIVRHDVALFRVRLTQSPS